MLQMCKMNVAANNLYLLNNLILVFCALFFILSHGYTSFGEQLFEGDRCQMSDTGLSGTCTAMPDCFSAMDAFTKNKTHPQTCSFNKSIPIVCCPNSQVITRFQDLYVEVAEKMCECYHNYQSPNVLDCEKPIELNSRFGEEDIGLEIVDPRIKNGVEANSREFPHMVALGFNTIDGSITWACGGTLISSNYVLTAAHCLVNHGQLVHVVRMGDVNMRDDDGGENRQEILVVNRTRHPKYSSKSWYYDIALLKLEKAVLFSEYARPACLNTEKVSPPTICTATGWGVNNWQSTEGSQDLMKADLRIEMPSRCSSTFRSLISSTKLSSGITDLMLCAGDPEERRDTCRGDSGGPIQIKSSKFFDMYNILGVTSFGTLCTNISSPAVYTRVSGYIPWIVSEVWPQRLPSENSTLEES